MTLLDLSIVLFLRLGILLVLYGFLVTLLVVVIRELRSSATAGPAAGHERLVVVDAGDSQLTAGDRLALLPVTYLGRDPRSHIAIESDLVSALHASAYVRAGRWWIRDEESTNGTLLNGRRLQAEAPLQSGDEIEVGGVRLQVEV